MMPITTNANNSKEFKEMVLFSWLNWSFIACESIDKGRRLMRTFACIVRGLIYKRDLHGKCQRHRWIIAYWDQRPKNRRPIDMFYFSIIYVGGKEWQVWFCECQANCSVSQPANNIMIKRECIKCAHLSFVDRVPLRFLGNCVVRRLSWGSCDVNILTSLLLMTPNRVCAGEEHDFSFLAGGYVERREALRQGDTTEGPRWFSTLASLYWIPNQQSVPSWLMALHGVSLRLSRFD